MNHNEQAQFGYRVLDAVMPYPHDRGAKVRAMNAELEGLGWKEASQVLGFALCEATDLAQGLLDIAFSDPEIAEAIGPAIREWLAERETRNFEEIFKDMIRDNGLDGKTPE